MRLHNLIFHVQRKAKKLSATFFYIVGPLGLFVLLYSCQEPDTVGLEVQPSEDRVDVLSTDTLTILTYTVREDSVKTDEVSRNLLGSYVDPVFGFTTASIYTQLTLPKNDVTFPTGSVLDSAVLSLEYSGYYGDTLAKDVIEIYELDESIYVDSSYYSNDSRMSKPTALMTLQEAYRPETSVKVGTEVLPPQLRIRLDNLGASIFNESGTTNLANNENFQEFFKGLFIKSNEGGHLPGEGAIAYFNLASENSKFTLYYHDNTDTSEYDLIIDQSSARFNVFDHGYSQASSTDILDQLADSSLGSEKSYVQAIAGVKTKVQIPFIRNIELDGSKVAINKAELVVKVDQGSIGNYDVPDRLLLIAFDEEGRNTLPIDYNEGVNQLHFGGTYDGSRGEYRFNISRHFQRIMNGQIKNHGFALLVSGSSVNASRVVIFGGKNSNSANSMKLELTLTNL